MFTNMLFHVKQSIMSYRTLFYAWQTVKYIRYRCNIVDNIVVCLGHRSDGVSSMLWDGVFEDIISSQFC